MLLPKPALQGSEGVTFLAPLWVVSYTNLDTVRPRGSTDPVTGSLVPGRRPPQEAQEPGRSGEKTSTNHLGVPGKRAEQTSVTYRITPLGEGAAPALERPSRSRKWRVCLERAAGSRCPEAETLAELARRLRLPCRPSTPTPSRTQWM